MHCTQVCRALARAGVLVAALALAPSAFAHADLYPGRGRGRSRRADPAGRAEREGERLHDRDHDDRAERVRGRERRDRRRAGRPRSNGDNGSTLEGQARAARSLVLLPFTGSAKNEGDYAFKVSQTYSDGSVVDWSGAEDSDTPALVVAVGRRRARSGGVALRLHQDDRDHRARRGRARAGRRRRRSRRREALGMRVGGRAGALLVAFVVALAVPALAQGHASLLATQPQASGVLSQPPTQVRLTFSERIEPRFAVISVTDAGGNQEIAGSPARAADDENSIFVPVKTLSQGWYLVWWRVISADGHPVRGAFTFAVGPSPGPPPQFVIPSLGESAATPSLVGSRWVAAARDDGRHRPARVPRRDRTAAAGDGRERARAAGRHDCRGRRPRRSPSSPRRSICCSRPRNSR